MPDPTGTRSPGKSEPQSEQSERKHHHHKHRKPYEEIRAAFNGNEVKIRIPKSTYKNPKLTPSQLNLQQQCTCDDDESMCSEHCGMSRHHHHREPQGNKLNFQIPDDITEAYTNRTAVNSEMVYCKKEGHDPLCRLCNVTPTDAPKGVHAQKVLYRDKDVFLLKIGKQTDEPNRTGNIEVELVTPKAPAKPKPVSHFCRQVQCEETDIPCCVPFSGCRAATIRKRIVRRRCH